MRIRRKPPRLGVIGLGWVGQEVLRALQNDARAQLVGVADTNDAMLGRDPAEFVGGTQTGLRITQNLAEFFRRGRPEVVVVSTSSKVKDVIPTVLECVRHDAHVVTSCENLAAPHLLSTALRRRLDDAARHHRRVIVATGVNPGFAMDRLVVTLGQATRNIRRIAVTRIVDAATRRPQLQDKVGVGLSRAEFECDVAKKRLGHAGLLVSLRLIALGLGLELERSSASAWPLYEDDPTPSNARDGRRRQTSPRVRGMAHVASGFRKRKEVIRLALTIARGEAKPGDVIDIDGDPPIHVEGAFPGDACTIATLLSAAWATVAMVPGFVSPLSLPLVGELSLASRGGARSVRAR